MSPLDNLLNQVSYQNRKKVKDDITAALERYKSLLPKITKFGTESSVYLLCLFLKFISSFPVQNNGADTKVIALSGTIPITFGGVQYNLPVEIFIPDRYPQTPPKAYLRPTPSRFFVSISIVLLISVSTFSNDHQSQSSPC
jgi:hypothetical protein